MYYALTISKRHKYMHKELMLDFNSWMHLRMLQDQINKLHIIKSVKVLN